MAGDTARKQRKMHVFIEQCLPNTHLKRLAWLKCQRYFVERANQDAKTELGWDEENVDSFIDKLLSESW